MKKSILTGIVFCISQDVAALDSGYEKYMGYTHCLRIDPSVNFFKCSAEQDAYRILEAEKLKKRSDAALQIKDKKAADGELDEIIKITKKRLAFEIAQTKTLSDYREKPKLTKPLIAVGMTKKQALSSHWGKPEKVIQTSTVDGVYETWIYDVNHTLQIYNGRVSEITIIQ